FRGTTLTSDAGATHGTLPRGTWYRIKFTLDTDTKTVYTSVNGAVVYTGSSKTLGNSIYSILYQQTSGAIVSIDNIKYVVKSENSDSPSTPPTSPDEPGDESEPKEPTVYYDFDDMAIGNQLYNGTVTEYKGNKMLRQNLNSSGQSTKFYAMIPGDAVFSFDFAAVGGPVEGKMTFESGNEAGHALTFKSDGNVISYNNIQITKYDEEVKNIAVVFKANQQNFDIYVNGERVVRGCYTKIRFDKIVNIELNFSAPGEKADIYLDNIMAYPTYEKIEGAIVYDPDARPVWDKEIILTDNIWFIDEDTEKAFMADKVSVHMRSGVVCVNNEKTTLANMPYVNGDELMVPAEFFKIAYGITPLVSDTAVTLGNNIILDLKSPKISAGNKTYDIFCSPQEKNGIMYLPLRAIVEKGMSKQIYHDTTATHSGMVIISDSQIEPWTGDRLQNLNDYCFYLRPTPEQWLADYNASPLKGQHPRLMATEADFERLKIEIETNERKKAWFKNIIKYCDELVNKPTMKYELRDGIRLMYISSEFTDLTTTLSFAYKITGDKKYLDAAWRQIESIASFPDWNPIHHIDVGMMAYGFGIAYDWLYHDLTPEQRAIMERAVYNNLYWIVNEAHQDIYTVYGDPGMKDNHNVLCNAGLIACVVAFMDVHPEVGSQLGAHTMRLLERFMWLFAPIGEYFEGPSYASVSIDYTAQLFAAMETCMGTLYGLDKAEAFDLSADYIMNMQSDVASFGFGDGNSDLKRSAGMIWIYNHYGIKGKKDAAADLLAYKGGQDAVNAILYYNVEPDNVGNDTSGLSVYYPGEDLVLARNSFESGQVYVGLKCGGTLHSHSHLDSGSFVFDAMGTRWAHDLGQDDYNLQWEWGFYDIYRRRPESHNTLIIDPDGGYGYELDGRANFLSYDIKPKGVIAKTDLTELYGDKVTSAKRGFFFTDDRRSLVVRDEVSLTGNSDLYWLMCISEKAEIIDENTVILTKRNNSSKKVKIEFISSTGEGTIEIGAAAPFPTSPQIPEQNPNKGYQRLSYKVSGSGNVNITAKITPMGFEASDISEYDKNMDLWTIPNGGETDEFVFDSQTNEVKIKVSKDEFSSGEGTVVAALYEKGG
ncbi:MAG: heparinase II/III family protein, partial [Clostridia bacterium]|nr:heparinase II/III family protein [Clostridia bacterium]